MTFAKANRILRDDAFVGGKQHTEEELYSAVESFGVVTFEPLCYLCSRYATCELRRLSEFEDKVVRCQFYK